MLNNYITILTFIPWLLIFIKSIIKNLNNDNYLKYNFKYLKTNFFKIFRLELLFLIVVFFYFASYKLDFVSEYLFVVINLYLFVNSFYEKKIKLKKDFYSENLSNLIFLFFIIIIPIIIYVFKNNLIITYKIMFIYLFLEYPLILIINTLSKTIKKYLS